MDPNQSQQPLYPQQNQFNQPPQQNQFNQPPQQQQYQPPVQQGQPPQQQYAPPPQATVVVQGSAPAATTAYGAMAPIQVTCATCRKTGITRMEQNTINVVSALWCIFGGCWCSFIPGCCPTQTEYVHHCSSCGAQVGKKEAQCC